MKKLSALMLASLLTLAGCGGDSSAPAPAPEVAAGTTAPAPPAADAQPSAEAAVGADGEEADGESVESAAASDVSPIAAALAANTPGPAEAGTSRWKEGENYQAYPVAQPVSTAPGSVEVVEAFWYGCGHCYSLEPRLVAWEESKPDWIKLRRIPVIWNEVTREDARLFYTIESLGLVDKLHSEVYRQIHARGKPLTVIRGNRVDRAATEKAAREFLMSHGVSAEDFAKHYRTFSTENKLRQAENLSRRYLLDHTPMVVVHGKYLTDVEMAGGIDQLFQLVNDLAARERSAT